MGGNKYLTDTTVFDKVNYEELYEAAKVFVNDKMKYLNKNYGEIL
jgi:hypothetical protein